MSIELALIRAPGVIGSVPVRVRILDVRCNASDAIAPQGVLLKTGVALVPGPRSNVGLVFLTLIQTSGVRGNPRRIWPYWPI